MKIKTSSLGAVAVAALLAAAGIAAANPVYMFQNITNNNAADAATGEAQLRMQVVEMGGGQVGFRFTNIGSGLSAITDIYFDDRAPGALSSLAGIQNATGPGTQVNFEQYAKPANLPGGGSLTPAFQTNIGFSAQSVSPAFHNGVGNTLDGSEWVTIVFGLAGLYDGVIEALSTGSLRVGLHVQGFQGGGSEAFVNVPPPVIPLPATAGLSFAGILAMGGLRRRR
jgi:hypothetical protein